MAAGIYKMYYEILQNKNAMLSGRHSIFYLIS